MLQVLHRISSRCLQLEPSTAEHRLPEILGVLGVQLSLEAVLLLRVYDRTAELAGRWTRQPSDSLPERLSMVALPDLARRSATLAPFVVRRGIEPDTGCLMRVLDPSIRSACIVPAAIRGVPIALLVLGHPDPDHVWDDEWLVAVRIAAEHLAQALVRVEHEQRKLLTDERFRMFSEASSEAICVHRDGYIIDVNEAALRLFRSTREAAIGRYALDFVHPDERPEAERRFRKGLAALDVSRLHRDDGTWFWCEVHSRQYVTPRGRVRMLVMREVTARVEAEQLLRESEERFRILGESTYDGIVVSDGGRVLQANPSFAEMFGLEPHTVVGRQLADLHPPGTIEPLLARSESDEADAVELVGIRADGSTFPVLVRSRSCRMHGRPVQISGYLDLTARKAEEAERRSLEAQVRHVQKLESLGLLAGGIAHDFNNSLVAMLGYAELALDEPELPPAVKRALDRIRAAAGQASELTRQMLAYTGKGRLESRRIDINARIRSVAELLEVSRRKNTELVLDLAPELWAVEGDAGQIDQIVLNLVTNASDAIGDRHGAIRVTTRSHELTRHGPPDVLDAPLQPGRYVVLEVTDDGSGMDETTRQNIFEPFYTTKYTGRGLGLAAVQGIIRGHGGAIEVDSTPSEGTTFRVWLPAVVGSIETTPHSPTRAVVIGTGTVLVADDEDAVRDVTSRMLQRLGFRTRTAADGIQALHAIRQSPETWDLVVLDMTMPGPSGLEVLESIQRARPGLPVILCSGHSAPLSIEKHGVTWLQKPFRLDDLVRAVQTALGA